MIVIVSVFQSADLGEIFKPDFFFLLRIEALTKAERADREIKVPLFQSSNIRLKLINIRDRKHLLNYLTDCGKGCA